MLLLAGAAGIEPTQTVLETVVLPLYDAPSGYVSSIFLIGRAFGPVDLAGKSYLNSSEKSRVFGLF
jgi:hypothetical protein